MLAHECTILWCGRKFYGGWDVGLKAVHSCPKQEDICYYSNNGDLIWWMFCFLFMFLFHFTQKTVRLPLFFILWRSIAKCSRGVQQILHSWFETSLNGFRDIYNGFTRFRCYQKRRYQWPHPSQMKACRVNANSFTRKKLRAKSSWVKEFNKNYGSVFMILLFFMYWNTSPGLNDSSHHQ